MYPQANSKNDLFLIETNFHRPKMNSHSKWKSTIMKAKLLFAKPLKISRKQPKPLATKKSDKRLKHTPSTYALQNEHTREKKPRVSQTSKRVLTISPTFPYCLSIISPNASRKKNQLIRRNGLNKLLRTQCQQRCQECVTFFVNRQQESQQCVTFRTHASTQSPTRHERNACLKFPNLTK